MNGYFGYEIPIASGAACGVIFHFQNDALQFRLFSFI